MKPTDTQAVKDSDAEDTPIPQAESAPADQKQGDAGGQVETPDNDSPEDQGSKSIDSKTATIVELRRDRRSLKSELAEAKEMIQQLQVQIGQRPNKPEADESERKPRSTDFFDDPERHLAERDRRLQLETIRTIELLSEKKEALKLIRSQEGFSEQDEDALVDLMEENGLDVVAQRSPLKAAKLALKLWREEKGLAPERPNSPAKKAQAGSVRGSAPAGGPKVITRTQLADLQRRASRGEDVRKELAEAWTAAKEGRVSED